MEKQPKDIGFNDSRIHDASIDRPQAELVQIKHQGVLMPPTANVPFSVFDEYGTCLYCRRQRPGSKIGTRGNITRKKIDSNIGGTSENKGMTQEQVHNVDKKKLYVEKVSKPVEDDHIDKFEETETSKHNNIQWKQKTDSCAEKEIEKPGKNVPKLAFDCPRYF